VQDPIVTVFGEDWSLTLACPWSGVVNGHTLTWEDETIEDVLWDLVGQDLVGFDRRGPSTYFRFTSAELIAEPDSDLDPWVLTFPSGVVVGTLE
jgi:hypothetical protein